MTILLWYLDPGGGAKRSLNWRGNERACIAEGVLL
jgi:hypothetical protein